MSEVFEHLFVFLDTVHVGCAQGGFQFSISAPTGRFPAILHRHEGVPGRLTIIFDPQNVEESFAEELFEPLDTIHVETGALMIAGDAARTIWERGERTLKAGSNRVDETGANIICVPVENDASVEVAWWYGGDDEADHQGIVALDVIWNPALDPVSADSPVRNLETIIRDFLNEHGPPSLRSDAEEDA